jgi:hypothetical protein
VTGSLFDRNPLGQRSVEEILRMADEFDGMAATAVTPDGKQALARLATRLRPASLTPRFAASDFLPIVKRKSSQG